MSHFLRSTVFGSITVLCLTCLGHGTEPTYRIISHPNSEPPKGAYLGHSGAVLDWNADGVLDVAGGAPGENRTYVFLGPDFTRHEVVAVEELSEGDGFGNKITAGNLNSTPGDELVIAAPKAKVGNVERAGAVWVCARPQGASSHCCSGAVAAQIVPGSKEELVLGSPRWSPPGKPKSWQSGRLMIMQVDEERR